MSHLLEKSNQKRSSEVLAGRATGNLLREERLLSASRERTEMSLDPDGTNRAEGMVAPITADELWRPHAASSMWMNLVWKGSLCAGPAEHASPVQSELAYWAVIRARKIAEPWKAVVWASFVVVYAGTASWESKELTRLSGAEHIWVSKHCRTFLL